MIADRESNRRSEPKVDINPTLLRTVNQRSRYLSAVGFELRNSPEG
jgi:hypothetical protein